MRFIIFSLPSLSLAIEVYFIRHGRSTWNEAAEMNAQIIAARNTVGPMTDDVRRLADRRIELNIPFVSSFRDAHLSREGVAQARGLARAIASRSADIHEDEAVDLIDPATRVAGLSLLAGIDPEARLNTYIATSNLRRAVLTGLIALHARTRFAPLETMHILSCAQEISFGDDAMTSAAPGTVPSLGAHLASFHLDATHHTGDENRRLLAPFRTHRRLDRFCHFVGHLARSTFTEHVILTGHSMWLQRLFQRFLRPTATDKGNRVERILMTPGRKLGNASVIKFTIELSMPEGETACSISAGRTALIYGNFEESDQPPPVGVN